MNLFFSYQQKISKVLKYLNKKKIIIYPKNFKNFTIELSPKDHKSDISTNIAMVLAKLNKLLDNNYTEVDNEYGPTIGSQTVRIIEDECIDGQRRIRSS